MTMPFSKLADAVSESMRKCGDAADLDAKALAAEELSARAGDLSAHTARYARIAWALTVLCLLLAILVFEGVLYFKAIERFLPPEMCRMIEPVYDSIAKEGDIRLSDEAKLWLYCILGLAAIPAAFDVILAAVCKRAPAAVGKAAAKSRPDMPYEDWGWVRNNLDYVQKTLDSLQNELDAGHTIPFRGSQVLCILFMLPTEIAGFFISAGNVGGNLLLVVLTGITWFLLCCVPTWLILNLQRRALRLSFSKKALRKQARKLRDEFLKNKTDDGQRYEAAWWGARRQRGEELYRQATAGGTVNRELMEQAAELGNPQANFFLGKRILRPVEEENLTRDEIRAICAKASKYLERAYNIPDGIFLYAYTQLETEWHSESEWTGILRRVQGIDRARLSKKCESFYDELVDRLALKVDIARSAAKPNLEDVMRRMGSGGGFGSDWNAMNDDLDAVRHARDITKKYGVGWKGYDPEAPSSDPESFPDSNDIW